jgi:DNA polymerase III epsilon subunit-like protein
MPVIKILPHPEYCPHGAEVTAPAGTSICEALLDNHINIEHACDMSCACTTCHVIVREGFEVPQRARREREEDLLDRAWGLEPQFAPELPGHPGAAGCGGRDPQVLDQPRQGEPLMSMRQIVLDTETTGLYAEGGDRIIEIGCVELLNRKLTGNNLHFYLNPGRDSHEDALKVHGISNEFLRDKPKFAAVADELLDYVQGGDHHPQRPFDVGFLNKELELLGRPPSPRGRGVTDTLVMAKEMFPGKRNSLDACATAWAWTTRAAPCTAHCWTPNCWPTSTST